MRIIIVSHDLSQNALGRAHVIWTLARAAGFETAIRGTSRGPLWAPLRDSEMAGDVRLSRNVSELAAELRSLATPDSLLVPIKTWPASLGVCIQVSRSKGVPLLADIDDPDHSALVGADAPEWYRRAFRLRMRLRGQSPRYFDQLQDEARHLPRMVSNPELQQRYGGGYVVPHAREVEQGPLDFGVQDELKVAFVGTPRAHKGLSTLRGVVAELANSGVRLTVTASAPCDARPWEDWVGTTDLAAGRRIVATADAIVVPQGTNGYAPAQLPSKLIDAMSLGRPIVATDTPPIRWALGEAGIRVPTADSEALLSALRLLTTVDERRSMGVALRKRAVDMFSVGAVRKNFVEAVRSATSSL